VATVTQPISQAFRNSLTVLAFGVLSLGMLASVLYSLQFSLTHALSVMAAGVAVGGAACAIGGFVGFLFGVPRTLQSDRPANGGTSYLANTNLEQISDWLTKILVGVGLVQIGRAPDALADLATALGPVFGGISTSPAFGLSIVMYFAVAGLGIAYLWTSAVFRAILTESEGELSSRIQQVIDHKSDVDAQALALADRQLTGQSAPTQEELNEAIAAAGPEWLLQIYRRAEEVRIQNWRDDKPRMAKSIPVFRALAAADTRNQFFRHLGSLGLALKDQDPPDYEAAAEQLTKAIRIRGRRGSKGLAIYEWNRALCRIRLDSSVKEGKPTPASARTSIEEDLRTAAGQLTDDYFQGGSDPDLQAVKEWMDLNGLTLSGLRSATTRGPDARSERNDHS